MFFIISKSIIFLTDPLFIFLILCLWCFLRLKKRLIPLLALLVFYSLSTPFLSQRLMYFLEHLRPPTQTAGKYDAVVVLSGMTKLKLSSSEKIEFSEAVDRILAGIEIMRSDKADYLILSGGDGSLFQKGKSESESELLAHFSQQFGVPLEKILIDYTSRNTYENAVNTKKIIDGKGFKKILLITSAFHMVRSQGCFNRQNLAVDVLPVDFQSSLSVSDFRSFLPSSDALSLSRRFFHESAGILAYGLTGKAQYFFFED